MNTYQNAAPVPPMPPVAPTYVQTNHVLHLILSLVTFGMWALCVWPWLAIVHMMSNSSKRSAYERQLAEYQQQLAVYEQRRYAPQVQRPGPRLMH